MGSERLRSSAGVLLALALLFGSLAIWHEAKRTGGLDFYQFWAVGRSIGARDDIYSPAAREQIGSEFWKRAQTGSERQRRLADYRRVLETYSTPFLYSAFRQITSDDYDRSLDTYRAFVVLGMAIGVLGLCRRLGYSATDTLGALLVLLFWFEPFLSDLRVANLNGLQLCLLATFLWSQSRLREAPAAFLGGAILGLGTLLKPNLAPIVAFVLLSWGIRRRFAALTRAAAGFVVAAIAAVAFTGLYFRSLRCWSDWFLALRNLPDDITTIPMGNFAPARLLDEWLGLDLSPLLPALVGSAGLVALWIDARRASGTRPKADGAPSVADAEGRVLGDTSAVAIGGLFTLLVSRLVWLHYYVLAVPMILLLLRPFPPGQRMRRVDLVVRRALPALALIGIAITPIKQLIPSLGDRTAAVIVCASTLMLFMAGLASLTFARVRPQGGD